MARDLWKVLSADRVDHLELQGVIAGHFGSAIQPRWREVVYPGDGVHDEYALRLVFSKDNALRRIEAGSLWTDALESDICTEVQSALLSSGAPRAVRIVLFANQPLTGSFRHQNWLQISPLPEDAPRLNCIQGEHPLLLEVMIPHSTNSMVNSVRAQRNLSEAELLLAGLVNGSIQRLTRSVRFWWVIRPEARERAQYLQEGYTAGCAMPQGPGFSDAGALAPLVPALALFGPDGILGGRPLCIPDHVEAMFALYESLGPEKQEQFLRACYWLQFANGAVQDSFSAAFLAIITAAEALFGGAPSGVCRSCGQHQFGLSTSFVRFIDDCIPLDIITSAGSTEHGIPSFRSRLKQLYATRSKLTHGSDLLGRDVGFGSDFTPLHSREEDDLRTLLRIMPYALATWLARQEPPGNLRVSWQGCILRKLAVGAGMLHGFLLRGSEWIDAPRAQKTV